jgi:hypothetical protein
MQMRFQIGLVKCRLVFLFPYHLTGFLTLNGGEAACFKRHGRASPFLAARIAGKAERE